MMFGGRGRGLRRQRGGLGGVATAMMGPMFEWVRIDEKVERNKNEDEIFFFEPEDSYLPCNDGNESNIILPESYYELLCTSMIPELRVWDHLKEDQHLVSERVSGISAVYGALFTLSFQIVNKDEIRLYLWWNAQCIRLHIQDIWYVLPYIFVCDDDKFKINKKFINDDDIKVKLSDNFKIKDKVFREFYENISMINQEE